LQREYSQQARFCGGISRVQKSERRNSGKMFAMFRCTTNKIRETRSNKTTYLKVNWHKIPRV